MEWEDGMIQHDQRHGNCEIYPATQSSFQPSVERLVFPLRESDKNVIVAGDKARTLGINIVLGFVTLGKSMTTKMSVLTK